MSEYSAAWERELRALGADVEVIVKDWKSGPIRDPLGARDALRNRHPDIVFAHTWVGWGPALSFQKKIPYVVAAHGAEILGPARSPYYRFLLRQSMKGANRVFAVSRFTADHVAALGLSRERIAVIGNGVDPDRFSRSEMNGETLLTVGGLVERKGHDTVIEAIALLKNTRPQLKYVIAGGWSLNLSRELYLRELVAARGVDDRVTFTGFVDDDRLPDVYRSADLFIMTGREVTEKGWVEGFGISYLEAAAAGLPIVATNVGGVTDAVRDNAIFVPPDNPRATAEAIEKLLDDPALRDKMSRAGLLWARENTWRSKAEEGFKIMETILGR